MKAVLSAAVGDNCVIVNKEENDSVEESPWYWILFGFSAIASVKLVYDAVVYVREKRKKERDLEDDSYFKQHKSGSIQSFDPPASAPSFTSSLPTYSKANLLPEERPSFSNVKTSTCISSFTKSRNPNSSVSKEKVVYKKSSSGQIDRSRNTTSINSTVVTKQPSKFDEKSVEMKEASVSKPAELEIESQEIGKSRSEDTKESGIFNTITSWI